MAALIWRHGKSKAEALAVLQSALAASGHGGVAKWDGSKVEVRTVHDSRLERFGRPLELCPTAPPVGFFRNGERRGDLMTETRSARRAAQFAVGERVLYKERC
jgi:hypothetical protein